MVEPSALADWLGNEAVISDKQKEGVKKSTTGNGFTTNTVSVMVFSQPKLVRTVKLTV